MTMTLQRVGLSVAFLTWSLCVAADPQFREDYIYKAELNGWVKLHWLPDNWDNAFVRCQAEGATMMSPLDNVYKNAMISILKAANLRSSIFTGVHSIWETTDFVSLEGVPLGNISPLKNLVFAEDRGCVTMNVKEEYGITNGTLSTLPYMCYKKKTDKYEDPAYTDCGTTGKGYELECNIGSCYKFHMLKRSWYRAQLICLAEGGHLAVINSEKEAQFLKELMAEKYNYKYIKHPSLIGIYEGKVYGDWYTVHGQTVAEAGYNFPKKFDRFGSLDPTRKWFTEPKYKCGALRADGVMTDVSCTTLESFICEMKPGNLLTKHEWN